MWRLGAHFKRLHSGRAPQALPPVRAVWPPEAQLPQWCVRATVFFCSVILRAARGEGGGVGFGQQNEGRREPGGQEGICVFVLFRSEHELICATIALAGAGAGFVCLFCFNQSMSLSVVWLCKVLTEFCTTLPCARAHSHAAHVCMHIHWHARAFL